MQFALFFTDFWFQLARWIDSTILDALYGWGFGWNRPHTNFDPLVGLNNAFGDMLLMFVAGTMFLVLPGFWLASPVSYTHLDVYKRQLLDHSIRRAITSFAPSLHIRSPWLCIEH